MNTLKKKPDDKGKIKRWEENQKITVAFEIPEF